MDLAPIRRATMHFHSGRIGSRCIYLIVSLRNSSDNIITGGCRLLAEYLSQSFGVMLDSDVTNLGGIRPYV